MYYIITRSIKQEIVSLFQFSLEFFVWTKFLHGIPTGSFAAQYRQTWIRIFIKDQACS